MMRLQATPVKIVFSFQPAFARFRPADCGTKLRSVCRFAAALDATGQS